MLALGLVLALGAAPPQVVHWSVKAAPAKVKAGARFTVVIAGTIDSGWHLYALEEPEGGPTATEISLSEGDGAELLRVNESKPKALPDRQFGLVTRFYEGSAEFALSLRASPGAKGPLRVLVRYQSCNERVCLPPHTDLVEVPLQVE